MSSLRRLLKRLEKEFYSLPAFRGAISPRHQKPPEWWLALKTFELAGLPVPTWLVEFGTVFSGGSGTGKTTVMLAMMRSLLLAEVRRAVCECSSPVFDWRRMNWNVIAYTPKNDDFYWPLKAWLEPFGIPVRSTNPFRQGSWVWWPFKDDIKSLSTLEEAVQKFIKENPQDQNRYFRDAARLLLRAVLLSLLMTHPERITFRRVVAICKSRYLLRQVLSRTEETKSVLALIDEATQGQTAGSVFTTLQVALKDLEVLAAEVDDTPEERRYSLADIASKPGVWVWESDPRNETALELWNGLQDDVLTPHLLVRGDIGFTTYRFIDELPQMNGRSKSTNSQKLSEWGRSSRVRNVYAIQTPVQLEETWGREAADSFLGQCHNFVVFRHSDLGGRDYWSERIGRLRGFDENHSYSWQNGWSSGADGGSTSGSFTHSVSIDRFERPKVPPDAIGDLPIGSILYGLHGFAGLPISKHMNPETDAPDSLTFGFHLSPAWMNSVKPPRHPEFKPYVNSMKPPKLFLPRLEEDDFLALALDHEPGL